MISGLWIRQPKSFLFDLRESLGIYLGCPLIQIVAKLSKSALRGLAPVAPARIRREIDRGPVHIHLLPWMHDSRP